MNSQNLNRSFREIIKLGDQKQINIEKAKVFGGIVHLANTYTGAKFERPFTIDQSHILDACVDFVFSYFSMLRIDEIKTAFELALSGKLKDCDIATYYGKFTVQTLSIVLNAYIVMRKQIQAEFNHIQYELAKIKTAEEIEARNAATIKAVKDDYQKLLATFKLTGEFDEEEIKPFWGKILVSECVISFTQKEKEEIYVEAKQIVSDKIKSEIGVTEDMLFRKSLLKILNDVSFGHVNEDFVAKAKVKYSQLIVIKSILNK